MLSAVEKAVAQILLNFGVVKDIDLKKYIEKLQEDFPEEVVSTATGELFRRLNVSLKPMAFQIRSLVAKEDAGCGEDEDDEICEADRVVRVVYHGIVNLEDDFSAKKYGVNLKTEDLVFFKECLERLVQNKYQSVHDLVYLSPMAEGCRSGWKGDMEALIDRLIDEKWLQRTDRAFVEIGPRSHLELRPFIELCALKASGLEDATVDDETTNDTRQEVLGQLPQILFH